MNHDWQGALGPAYRGSMNARVCLHLPRSATIKLGRRTPDERRRDRTRTGCCDARGASGRATRTATATSRSSYAAKLTATDAAPTPQSAPRRSPPALAGVHSVAIEVVRGQLPLDTRRSRGLGDTIGAVGDGKTAGHADGTTAQRTTGSAAPWRSTATPSWSDPQRRRRRLDLRLGLRFPQELVRGHVRPDGQADGIRRRGVRLLRHLRGDRRQHRRGRGLRRRRRRLQLGPRPTSSARPTAAPRTARWPS